MSEYEYTAESDRKFWLRVAAGIGTVAAFLTMIKLGGNEISFNEGEDRRADYICLWDEAHGHQGPDIVSWSGDSVEGPDHSLDLPDGVKAVCYPTETHTARVSGDTSNPANGDWVRVNFGNVHRAIDNGTVIDLYTGRRIDPTTAARLGEFASNWPTDFAGQYHTWVNEYKASTYTKFPGIPK